jgi:hypothetical protein
MYEVMMLHKKETADTEAKGKRRREGEGREGRREKGGRRERREKGEEE